jgi:hypothetical protein
MAKCVELDRVRSLAEAMVRGLDYKRCGGRLGRRRTFILASPNAGQVLR